MKHSKDLIPRNTEALHGKFVWMDGKFVPDAEALTHVIRNETEQYGIGIFEGLRYYKTRKGRAIFRLRKHIDRFLFSASVARMNLRYSRTQLERAVIQTVKKSGVMEGYIRPVGYYAGGITPNPDPNSAHVAIGVEGWGKYFTKTLSVGVPALRRLDSDTVVIDAKLTGYYINSFLANMQARDAGYDEALLLDKHGNIAEGPGENFFMVKRKKLYTPEIGSILPGITRSTVQSLADDMKIPWKEKKISIEDAKLADEAFFVGTAVEVTPIRKINGVTIGSGDIGQITQQLMHVYHDIVHGEYPKYRKWITFVDIAA